MDAPKPWLTPLTGSHRAMSGILSHTITYFMICSPSLLPTPTTTNLAVAGSATIWIWTTAKCKGSYSDASTAGRNGRTGARTPCPQDGEEWGCQSECTDSGSMIQQSGTLGGRPATLRAKTVVAETARQGGLLHRLRGVVVSRNSKVTTVLRRMECPAPPRYIVVSSLSLPPKH